MKRKEVVAAIATALDKAGEYEIAVGPTHPDLFQAPDVLAGGDGQLTAIFLPTASEYANPHRLLTRLVLNRLALPGHTRCLLVFEENEEPRYSMFREVAAHFDKRLSLRGIEQSRLWLPDTNHLHTPAPFPNEIRQSVYARSSVLMGITMSNTSFGLSENFAEGEVLWESGPPPVVTRHSVRETTPPIKDIIPADLKWSLWRFLSKADVRDNIILLSSQRTVRPRDILPDLITNSTLINYAVDNGMPYSRTQMASILVTPSLRWPARDPVKAIRAAAFGGWAIIEERSHLRVKHLIDRLSAWLKGGSVDYSQR